MSERDITVPCQSWPTVLVNDDGIRPAGKPGQCFYCQQKIGHPHKQDCVTVQKKVRVRYSFDIEIVVPHFWTKSIIEFHRNESSWCADNAIRDLEKFMNHPGTCCLCDFFNCQLLEETDTRPRRTITLKDIESIDSVPQESISVTYRAVDPGKEIIGSEESPVRAQGSIKLPYIDFPLSRVSFITTETGQYARVHFGTDKEDPQSNQASEEQRTLNRQSRGVEGRHQE